MKATVSDRQNIGINGPYPYYALMSDFDEMLRNLCDDCLQVREPSGLLDLRRLAWCLK